MKKNWILSSFLLGCIYTSFAQFEQNSVLDEIVIPLQSAQQFYKINSSRTMTDSILLRHNGTATDLLKQSAAIHFKENGYGMVSSASFRGTTAQQTSVIWNGIPINSNFLGQTDFNSLSIKEFDEIEIIAGGGSVLLGSGAIGGSILLNQKVDFQTKDQHRITVSYNTLQAHQTQLQNRWVKKNWFVSWNTQYTNSKNEYKWENINWKNNNGAYENFTFSPVLAYKISDKHSLSYFGSIYKDQRHFSLISSFQTPTKYENFSARNLIKWKTQVGHRSFEIDFAHWNENYQYYQNINNKNYLDGIADTYFAKLFYQWKLTSYWNNSVQAEHKHSTGNSTENPLKDIRQSITNISWLHSIQFNETLKSEIGLKKEWSDVYDNPFLYSFALQWTPKDWTLSFSSNKNYRIPSFNDLFWQPGGNKNLKPETSIQNEFRLGMSRKQWNIQANTYYNAIKDMIRWMPTSSGYWRAENTNKVRIFGLEFQGNYIVKRGDFTGSIGVQYAYTNATNVETDLQLMYVPKNKFTGQISGNYKNWELNIQMIQLGNIFTTSDENIEYQLESYTTLDTQIGYKWGNQKQWFAQVQINNLGNTFYYTMPERPMPNRNSTLKLSYQF